MAGFNRIILVGNLTRDPEFRQLASGQGVCRLGLATNRQFKNRQTGSLVQEVCYVDIDVWGAQAESARQYLSKGRSVLIEGRLKFDTWEDQNGQTRSKHSVVADRVVFLSSQTENTTSSFNSDESQDEGRLDSNPNKAVENDLLAQLEQAKTKVKAAKSEKAKKETKSDSAGEVSFKDEPPFEDELPF